MPKSRNSARTRKGDKQVVIFDAQIKAPKSVTLDEIVRAGGRLDKFLDFIGLKENSIPVDRVQKNMTSFVTNVQDILSNSSSQNKDFMIESVEVNAQISAEGQIGFLGTHAGISGSAGITIVFKRINSG